MDPASLVPVSRSVVIVHSASSMDQTCSDSLLKLIEEPPSQALFILCTNDADLLPVTIRSRVAAVLTIEPAPVAVRLGSLVDAGLSRQDAHEVLSLCDGLHSVVELVLADPSKLTMVRSALGARLHTRLPIATAAELAGHVDELSGALLAAAGEKTSDTARRARSRVLVRALCSRWREELAAALRDGAALASVSAGAHALDELEKAMWRYRPLQAALTQAFSAANR
jgi:hypothetical protein